jgi:hypothetical protein
LNVSYFVLCVLFEQLCVASAPWFRTRSARTIPVAAFISCTRSLCWACRIAGDRCWSVFTVVTFRTSSFFWWRLGRPFSTFERVMGSNFKLYRWFAAFP